MKPLRVLIVDDEIRLREALGRAIASWGFEVASAHHAEEALHLMQARQFDIAILDLNLPLMSGIDLFERIRQRHPEIQVIVLSGFGNLESARAAIRLDVVDFLEKPCHLGELELSLHRATQRIKPTPPPVPPTPPAIPIDSGSTLEIFERQHIMDALKRHGGRRTAAASELGISRRTLQYKISQYQHEGYPID